MNEAIYRFADSGGSIRLVIQKKPDGDYIVGVSNGIDKPLICQGPQKIVDAEFESALPGYLEKVKADAIAAKLRAAAEAENEKESEDPDDNADHSRKTETSVQSTPDKPQSNEQPELDFGF